MKLLIDGDCYAYRAGFATDKTSYMVTSDKLTAEFDNAKDAKEAAFSNDGLVWSRKEAEPEDKALMLVDLMLNDLKARYASENATAHLFLSGVGNYRHLYATRATYKGNRSGSVPPTHLRAIRSHLVTKHGAIVSQGEEADDLLGIWMTKYPDSVCVSIDKDLRQLPGRHYDFVKKEETNVSAKDAVLNLYSQVISGDSTDNIPGATGYGAIRARKALESAKSPFDCWQVALGIYVKEFGDISGPLFALEAARLVYVRRHPVEIWDAPKAPAKAKAAA